MGFNLKKAARIDDDYRGSNFFGIFDSAEMDYTRFNRLTDKAKQALISGHEQYREAFNPYMETTTAQGLGSGLYALMQNSAPLTNMRSGVIGDYAGTTGLNLNPNQINDMAGLDQSELFGLEGLMSGRKMQGGQLMGGSYLDEGKNLANLYSSMAAANVGAQQQEAQAQGAGSSGLMGMVGGIASMFCDERLKKNIKPVGKLGEVTIYSYDANEEGERVGMNSRFGPMAQEVQTLYPDLVTESESGYLMVDMNGLQERAA